MPPLGKLYGFCLCVFLRLLNTGFAQQPKLILPVGHTQRVVSVQYSQDGKYVVSASWDNTAKVWDALTGHLLADLKGYTEWVTYAEFSPDGNYVLTISDSIVKVWEWKNNNQPTGYLGVQQQYIKDNILVMPLSGRPYQVVAINLDNGTQLWHTTLPEGGSFQMVGVDDKVFHIRSNYDRMKEEIFVTDIRTGNWQSVYAASNTNAPIFIRGMHCYMNKDGKNYLAFLVNKYTDFNFKESEFTLFKYSVDSSKMVSQKVLSFIKKNNAGAFFAKATMDRVERRDPNKTYNKMTLAEVEKLSPRMKWEEFFQK